MQLFVHAKPFSITPALDTAVRCEVEEHLGRFADQVRRVQVRLYDTNGTRGGVDKACRIHSDLGRARPLVVEVIHQDMYTAIELAFAKAEQHVEARLLRHRGRLGRQAKRGLRQSLAHHVAHDVTDHATPAPA